MVRLEVVALGASILSLKVLSANNIISTFIYACVPALQPLCRVSRGAIMKCYHTGEKGLTIQPSADFEAGFTKLDVPRA